MVEQRTQREHLDRMAKSTERGIELCVDCPLHKKHVPINGNCYEIEMDKRHVNPNFKGIYGESVKLPVGPTGVFYITKQKCQYAVDLYFGALTMMLRGVMCEYKEEKTKVS